MNVFAINMIIHCVSIMVINLNAHLHCIFQVNNPYNEEILVKIHFYSMNMPISHLDLNYFSTSIHGDFYLQKMID